VRNVRLVDASSVVHRGYHSDMKNVTREDDRTETKQDFFDQICEEVSVSEREGKAFAPGAIALTLSSRRRRTR